MALFKRFQASWPRTNQSAFSAACSDPASKQALKAASRSVIATQQFVTSLLERNDQPRDDDKEFLELVAVFLHGTPAGGIRFRAPGATSEGRRMAKVIYSLKVWVFRRRFDLQQIEEQATRDVSLLACLAYARSWFRAPDVKARRCSAQASDLKRRCRC